MVFVLPSTKSTTQHWNKTRPVRGMPLTSWARPWPFLPETLVRTQLVQEMARVKGPLKQFGTLWANECNRSAWLWLSTLSVFSRAKTVWKRHVLQPASAANLPKGWLTTLQLNLNSLLVTRELVTARDARGQRACGIIARRCVSPCHCVNEERPDSTANTSSFDTCFAPSQWPAGAIGTHKDEDKQ